MEVSEEMKTDRKWIVLVSTLVLVIVLSGCKKPKAAPAPVPPPEPVVVAPPTTDLDARTEPVVKDIEETPQPMTLADIEADAKGRGLLGDVYYSFDQYDLRPEARERLAKNAEWMQNEGRGLTFTIEGHCDERGTNEYNIALGQSRSTTAVDYLVSLGVDARRFKTVSFGEERPFCTETSESCWQQNRRAHFVVSGQS